ncbi:MAG TPA: DNA polymerase [Flavobacteriales bacterium]|nr:DNA polymerase [Flavobacteriales bacterium]
MAQLGDFLKAINQSKKNLMDEDPMTEKEYLPFVVNRTLSYFLDTVLYANEANIRNTADKKLQFDLLLNSIRSNRRFSRWLKPDENKDIDAIKEYYGYSNQRAKEVLDLLTGEQLSFIHERLSKGGLKNDRREKGRAS